MCLGAFRGLGGVAVPYKRGTPVVKDLSTRPTDILSTAAGIGSTDRQHGTSPRKPRCGYLDSYGTHGDKVMRNPKLGGVPREQKLLKGHLPRVIYHQVY